MKTVDFVRLVAMEIIREASAGKNSIHGCHLLTLSLDFCCGAVVSRWAMAIRLSAFPSSPSSDELTCRVRSGSNDSAGDVADLQ